MLVDFPVVRSNTTW